MATLNDSPIPVDELPTYYEMLSAIQMNQEVHLAISIVLVYEYFLTLDQEVEFIWKQRWRPSSALYIFVRYFGTLYNLTFTILMFSPQSVPLATLNLEPWAGCIIWWSVQGILQMRLYALYHRSKKLLVFMILVYAAEVGSIMWILISSNLLSRGSTILNHISFAGYAETNFCTGAVSAAFGYIWIPCLIFEAMLCSLAIYAGVKHSSHRSTQSNRPRLIDILIHGNVKYFLSPLGMFVFMIINSPNLKVQWLADALLFRAPITILAGCRLIPSIREATSSFQLCESGSKLTDSTIVFGDRSHLSQA